jgi:hypothetical protein
MLVSRDERKIAGQKARIREKKNTQTFSGQSLEENTIFKI